jgi:hypothetical protein
MARTGKRKRPTADNPKRKRPPPIVGWRVLQPLQEHLTQLHAQPAHGNRDVYADHVLVAHLIAFLSPALKGLRHIEQIFEHRAARRRFGLPRVPKSTLSDAQAIFDPNLLTPIIADLRRRAPTLPHEPQLDQLLNTLTAVDGTFFAMAPRVAWAVAYNKPNRKNESRKSNVRVDLHFNVLTGVPEHAVVTGGRTPEYRTLAAHLEGERFYVLDRGYHCYETWAQVLEAGSDFLVRLRGDMQFDVLEEHALSAADRVCGVTALQTVRVQGARGRRALDARPLKLLHIANGDDSPLRLLTNRVDLDADVIGVAYRHRWQIELFFRWLKCVVNFRHFFSESENGVALQIGAAVIGTLLIALLIEDRPSSYDYTMMVNVMSGLLPFDDETLEIMRRRREERARSAARQKAYRAEKKSRC